MPDLSVQRRGTTAALKANKAKHIKASFCAETEAHLWSNCYLRRGPAVERETQPASSIIIPPKACFITKVDNLPSWLISTIDAAEQGELHIAASARNDS